jgi:predicted metal-dependent phosphoesterase TrpH
MKNRIDMHVHSVFSDGDFTPTELFNKAKEVGLAGLVIADHTVISGCDEGRAAAARLDMHTCEGVEINGIYKETGVHILGYAKRFNRDLLLNGLRETIEGDIEYNSGIAQKLRERRIADIDTDAIVAQKGMLFKIDILRELVAKTGMSMDEAKRLTKREGAAHVPYPAKLISVLEAVKLIHRAGGVAVLAHPALFFARTPHPTNRAEKYFQQMLNELVREGLDGIEARSGRHTREQCALYEALARDNDLMITGGSDFHGSHEPEQHLGYAAVTIAEFEKFLQAASPSEKNKRA